MRGKCTRQECRTLREYPNFLKAPLVPDELINSATMRGSRIRSGNFTSRKSAKNAEWVEK